MMDYHNKVLIGIEHVGDWDITDETVFYCKQYGSIVQGKYYGGNVKYGELIGLVNDKGILQAAFSHFNESSLFFGGVCTFTPEKSPANGQLRLQAKWCLAEGQTHVSESVIEELLPMSSDFPC
ncbi:hypothetical protein HPT25_10040 [Bacillus sp. BRMEA1]|uniref:hypothetical protein n=1 Tax=Neobacillus endophyticus TaxID=2738405 RepID=UPI0015632E77|nr:hypothetical protein [Neobacillus endophyticus]NRD77760.1 hypothetical protein [Neobacillus endophyticus]